MAAETKKWIETVVVGLNLCPFAGSVMNAGKVRYKMSKATNHEDLFQELLEEVEYLLSSDPSVLETTFLIHPHTLTDFPLYLDFIDLAEEALEEGEMAELVQIAGFHPDYTFDDSDYDDPANYTNRSPYPPCCICCEAKAWRRRLTLTEIPKVSLFAISSRCVSLAWKKFIKCGKNVLMSEPVSPEKSLY
ncbi:MAG: DUF1415 family protein [Bacteroidia bacterium]|nr:DUF1415 family protein [Bacteroidia bacterium]